MMSLSRVLYLVPCALCLPVGRHILILGARYSIPLSRVSTLKPYLNITMKTPHIFIVLMALLCHAAIAQNKISGKITDHQGISMPGALVALPDLQKGTVTDSLGRFQLTNLPNGKHKVQASFLGYASVIETVELKGSELNLHIILHPSVIETEEIVVTGGSSSTQHENAVKIEILKLHGHHAKASPNFAEMLTQIPGVDMISKGNGVSKPVIRGLSMNDILVLNHGVRFENYQYSSHHPMGIDEFGLESVEVIKGPASMLYGSDAIGGVLNFIKEKPAPVGTVMGDYNLQLFSNSLGANQSLGIKGTKDNVFGGIRLGMKTNADYLQGGGDYVPNSRFNEQSFKANAGTTGKLGSFKLFYDYSQQNLGLVEDEAIESISERGRKPTLFYQTVNTHLVSSQNKLYLGKSKLEVNTAVQNTQLAHLGEPNEYELEMGLTTFTYDAKLFLPSQKSSEFIVGLQGMEQENRNLNRRETILLPNAHTRNLAFLGLAQHTWANKLTLQAGLRYDMKAIESDAVGLAGEDGYRAQLDKDYGSVSGSAGATYHVNNKWLVRANVASAYRTPNLAELTSNGPHETRYEVGDQSLVPEKSLEYDLSTHYHATNVTFDVAAFYNRVNDFIYIAPTGTDTPEGLPVYRYQQHDAVLKGGELGMHYHPRQLSWMHMVATYAMVVGKQRNGDYLPFIPAHKLNLEWRAEADKLGFLNDAYVSVNPSVAFDQRNAAPDETGTMGYTLWDVTVGTQLPLSRHAIYLSLAANNLFDKKYIDHLSTLKEVGMYNPGRNIVFSLRVPFGNGR